jgi:hypothetical protein
LSLRSDDLDSIGEPYTEDELGQVVVTIKAAIQFVRGIAMALNERDIPTPTGRKTWQTVQVRECWRGCEPTERAGLMPRQRRAVAGELFQANLNDTSDLSL